MTFSLESSSEGVDLVVTGGWSEDAQSCLEDGRADGLVLNYARGYQEKDLGFISGLPVRRVRLLARTVVDLSPIYTLADCLVSLRVESDPRATIELERLPLLRTLSAEWQQVRASIDSPLHLEHLYLRGYDEQDLGKLVAATSLVSLVLKDRPRVRSLDGVESLPWLRELGVHVAGDLEDLTALQRAVSPVLETLQLSSCRSVSNIEPVSSCTSLRFFELSEGSDIPTAAPLARLVGLESLYLYGSTRIVDGDLDPIARLPRLRDFRMQSRHAYKPSVADIQRAITTRG